jgi:aminoglycoside/choline kinase family phosphotransferase
VAEPDSRLSLLTEWLAERLSGAAFSIAPASSDASFRRYFRVTRGSGALIAMDAPPPQENCRPFVMLARVLRAAGVNAPDVIAEDLERGFLLLSDLGSTTYLAALDQDSAPRLYRDAIGALIRMQVSAPADQLPRYDRALLQRELDLFPDWYVAKHIGATWSDAEQAQWRRGCEALLANNLAQPVVFAHRDYHSRNLMVCDDNPGVLDFQDAVHGPITYDLVSLLRDAYIQWDEEFVLDQVARYWSQARRAGLPVRADFAAFYRDFEWMGVQRQLKVLGIFARLYHRDGKAAYLPDMPRVASGLRAACDRYAELRPLQALVAELDRAEQTVVRTGYTF